MRPPKTDCIFEISIKRTLFRRRKQKIDIRNERNNTGENCFFRIIEISDTVAEFPSGRLRWDSLSTFGASLRPSLLKLRFGPEKLINSALLQQEVIIH